ncbi:MAG TPA: (d)CMP kinase, partial [Dissulfurispiraceae bacterium]|nr:(d)CMP kinase [Dissulfurispiraceae bacterium]
GDVTMDIVKESQMGRVIAIDGPSGAGKSTVSRRVAERLGFQFLDTGALYRAIGLYLLRKGVAFDVSEEGLTRALNNPEIVFRNGSVHLNGEDVSGEIRTTAAGEAASQFSARKAVRDLLLSVQRSAAFTTDVVAEGRDIGTVVFPEAWRKFYLDASEEIRARRRYLQLKAKGSEITMEEAMRDVKERDRRDASREIAPLRRADDALYIDTTRMELEAVISVILRSVNC